MQTLKHDDRIRLQTWLCHTASVGTPAGYSGDSSETGEPWTVFAGSGLSDSPAYYAEKEAEFKGAAIVADGEFVDIEGQTYKVKVCQPERQVKFPKFSDPIKFTKV